MNHNKKFFIYFIILVVAGALYRIIPDRMLGFAPQIAMAIFGGSVIKDKKIAFALPLFSMFISDLLYHVLFTLGLSSMSGFYTGQWVNYLLIAGITIMGFFINAQKPKQILLSIIAAPTAYFLVSNFLVWIGNGGYQHPKTFAGMMACYADGIPFYKGSLLATGLFSVVFFGAYYLINYATKGRKIVA